MRGNPADSHASCGNRPRDARVATGAGRETPSASSTRAGARRYRSCRARAARPLRKSLTGPAELQFRAERELPVHLPPREPERPVEAKTACRSARGTGRGREGTAPELPQQRAGLSGPAQPGISFEQVVGRARSCCPKRPARQRRRGLHHSRISVVMRSATVSTPSGRFCVSSMDARNNRVICSRRRVRNPVAAPAVARLHAEPPHELRQRPAQDETPASGVLTALRADPREKQASAAHRRAAAAPGRPRITTKRVPAVPPDVVG